MREVVSRIGRGLGFIPEKKLNFDGPFVCFSAFFMHFRPDFSRFGHAVLLNLKCEKE